MGNSYREHRTEKFTRKVTPGGQVRQDGGRNQNVDMTTQENWTGLRFTWR